MLKKRICTFIDILGFQNLVVKADTDPRLVHQLIECLRLINNSNNLLDDNNLVSKVQFVLQKNANTKESIKFTSNSKGLVQGVSFSDSLIVSSEPNFNGWLNHILVLILLIHKLMELGFLVRGGTALGNLFQEKEIVFGMGLVKAYNLESKISNYPRIIVSDEAIENLERVEPTPGLLTKFFASDFDGILILNYLEESALRIASFNDEEETREGIKEHNRKYATRLQITRDSIQSIISMNQSADYKVLCKLRWIAMNMNRSLNRKEAFLVENVDIPKIPH